MRTRLTTYVLVQRSFGRTGAALVNIVIALVHFGWFGVNASFFGDAMVAATSEVFAVRSSFAGFVLVGGMLMAVTTIFGFRALSRLALIAVPILAAILVAVLVLAARRHGFVLGPDPTPPVAMTFGIALSALVGANMASVTAMPDITRYLRSNREASSACCCPSRSPRRSSCSRPRCPRWRPARRTSCGSSWASDGACRRCWC